MSASARPQVMMESATNQVSMAQNRIYTDYADTKGAMDDIARETGGQAFIGNDLKKIMERGIEQGSTYYTLAYSPAIKKWNAEYHKIEVKTAESGLKLEYRRGYYAVPEREARGRPGWGAVVCGHATVGAGVDDAVDAGAGADAGQGS